MRSGGLLPGLPHLHLVSWVCFLSSTMTSMVWAEGRAGCLEKDLRNHIIKAIAMLVPSCPSRRFGRGPPWLCGTAFPGLHGGSIVAERLSRCFGKHLAFVSGFQ